MRNTDHSSRFALRCRGFTLAESLLASVVLAIAVIGVSATLSASQSQSSSVQSGAIATAMARQLMEEVAAKPLNLSDSSPGWPDEPNRVKYDSILDYNGYSDSTPIPTLESEDADLTPVPFTRDVTVHTPSSLFGTTPPPGDFVIIEVNVRDSAGNGCVLHRLVSRANLQR